MCSDPFNFEKHKEEFIESVINFVYEHLSKWRDSPMRPNRESEKTLNPDLPKYLSVFAHANELPITFYHEEPQENRRTIDISVCFDIVKYYNKVITVFECKRLSTDLGKERADEYVTRHKEIKGGIQRFKLEAHGKDHEIVGMIGYVQTGTYTEWQKTINNCIDSLCGKPDENGLCWTEDEHLNTIEHDEKNKTYRGKSLHPRKTKSKVTIHHLWVDMQGNSA